MVFAGVASEHDHFLIHSLFDALAWLAAAAAVFALRRTWFRDNPVTEPLRFGYLAAVLIGAGCGAWFFGTLNAWASGQPGLARSVEGALAGAILAIELFKKFNGITARTGAIYALPLALGISIGRIGCLLSGMEDFTYGVATGRDWGWDFGDGILRHPVQLYESAMMAAFALVYGVMIKRGNMFWKINGFYLAAGFYAAQRFLLEFLKPYLPIAGPLTLFQLLSAALLAYALAMIATRDRSHS